MLVKWKGDGVCSVTPIDPEMKDPAAANLIPAVLLYPGWNDVPDNVWEKCRIHMVNYFNLEMIDELSKKEKDDKGNDTYVGILFADLASRKPTEAVEMVKNCFVTDTLDAWDKQTNRADINYAIRRQKEKIAKGYDDEENDEE